MKQELFNLKLSKIKEFRDLIAPFDDRRKIPMDFKECIARTFEELNDAVLVAQNLIGALTEVVGTPEYIAAVEAIWATKVDITATRIPKAQSPLLLKPSEMRTLWFMFTDWID